MYIDRDAILGADKTPISSLWVGSNPSECLRSLLSSTIALPSPSLQIPLIVSYLWNNPKFSEALPVLMCYGKPGSGKSTLGMLAAKIRKCEPLNADNCTPVSLRNTCNQLKFLNEEQTQERNGAMLILDNVQTATFKENRSLLALFLGGYKRGQDKIQIGSRDGGNIEFYTFSGRVISTVQPLHLDYALRELAARCFIVSHASISELSDDEMNEQGFDVEEFVSTEDILWSGFTEYNHWWNDMLNCIEYAKARKGLKNTSKLPPRHWEMARDLLATGIAIGEFSTAASAKSWLSDYLDYAAGISDVKTPLEAILYDEFLSLMVGVDTVPNSTIKGFIESKVAPGAFLEKPRGREIEEALNRLGRRKVRSSWERL